MLLRTTVSSITLDRLKSQTCKGGCVANPLAMAAAYDSTKHQCQRQEYGILQSMSKARASATLHPALASLLRTRHPGARSALCSFTTT